MSLGGRWAALFNAVLAPLVFSDVYEYPIAIFGGDCALGAEPRSDAELAQAGAGFWRRRSCSVVLAPRS